MDLIPETRVMATIEKVCMYSLLRQAIIERLIQKSTIQEADIEQIKKDSLFKGLSNSPRKQIKSMIVEIDKERRFMFPEGMLEDGHTLEEGGKHHIIHTVRGKEAARETFDTREQMFRHLVYHRLTECCNRYKEMMIREEYQTPARTGPHLTASMNK